MLKNVIKSKWGGRKGLACLLVFVFLLSNTGQAMAYYITTNLTNYTTNSVTINGELAGDSDRQWSDLEKFINARYVINGQHGPIGTTRWDTSTYGYEHWDVDFPEHTFTGLTPGYIYAITVFAEEQHVWRTGWESGNGLYVYYNVTLTPASNARQYVHTKCAAPAIYATNIKDTKLTVNWQANGNHSSVRYSLERRIPGNAWTTILNKVDYFTFTDSGLTPETTYEYRITAYNTSYAAPTDTTTVSQVLTVTTTADPAIAAAQEAATKAEVARGAAINAQTASQNAEAKANEAVDLIKALDTKFNTQLTNIQGQMQPAILSVKTTNGATATKSGSINIVATAINASQYRYRVNNGAFSGWQLSPVLNINSLSPGVNVIEVQATNSLEEGAPVSSGYITVFNLP